MNEADENCTCGAAGSGEEHEDWCPCYEPETDHPKVQRTIDRDLWSPAMADAIASRIAKREHGEGYEGYESTHWEAAKDYALAALKAIYRP